MHRKSFMIIRAVVVMCLLSSVGMSAQRADAYTTGAYWWTNSLFAFKVNQSLQSMLPGLAGQQASINQNIVNAAAEWNKASQFIFVNYSSMNCSFPSDGCFDAAVIEPYQWAVTSWHANSHILDHATVQFNKSFTWHLNGQEPDIYRIALHEFGHTLTLLDNPSYTWGGSGQSVEWYSGSKTGLYMDDKEGATMLYGPWTHFEVSEYLGLYQTLPFYESGVHSFGNCGTGYPDYWTYNPGSVGIPSSPSGGRVMQFAGCAVSNGSSANYAYMPFAVSSHDSPQYGGGAQCGDPCYLKVRSGMHLSWEQYNVTQCTVSIDIEFLDGSSLRDSGLSDTEGHSVHPQYRPCFSGWHSVDVNLSSLVGKTIRRILIVYDNPNGTSTWRSYFDNLQITY